MNIEINDETLHKSILDHINRIITTDVTLKSQVERAVAAEARLIINFYLPEVKRTVEELIKNDLENILTKILSRKIRDQIL